MNRISCHHINIYVEKDKLNLEQPRKYLNSLKCYYSRWRTRQQLRGLSHQQLEDIGISTEQARTEANQPFWK